MGATCGHLLSHEGTHIWLDAGTGTFARLQEHIGIDEIAAIVITHGHTDHFIDVVPAFYARHYGGMGAPNLPFYSPDGFVEGMSVLTSENGRNVMAEAYDFRTVRGGDVFDVGPFHITTYEMTHIGVNAVGYRIEADGAVLAYTGDSGPCQEVIEMSRDADLLVAEATYQDASNQAFFHMSATQAAQHAAAAGARRLMLTHILPTLDREISRDEAAAAFDGVIDLAEDDMTIEIAPRDGDRDRAVSRPDGRADDELRPVHVGARLPGVGRRVRAVLDGQDPRARARRASSDDAPRWLKGTGRGWVTGEYSMLPASTSERSSREVNRGRPGGRTQEIQRLIGRSLRSVTDLSRLGERTITIDCDVLQADAGTRTASITGGYIALAIALRGLEARGQGAGRPAQRQRGGRERRHRRRGAAARSLLRRGRGRRRGLQRRHDRRRRLRRGAGHGRGRAVLTAGPRADARPGGRRRREPHRAPA